MDAPTPNPWDRRPDGESSPAYAAFLTYRDLGPGRSLSAVSARIGPRKGTKGAPKSGRLGEWSARWGWVERCRAWDHHCQAERQKGIDKALAEAGALWETRRRDHLERIYKLSQEIMEQAMILVRFPVIRQTVNVAGESRTFEAINPRDLRTGVAILVEAQGLAWHAIHTGLESADDGFNVETATPDECRAYVNKYGARRAAQAGVLPGGSVFPRVRLVEVVPTGPRGDG